MQCHLYTVRNIYSCLHYRSNVCNQIKIWSTLYILVQYSEIPIYNTEYGFIKNSNLKCDKKYERIINCYVGNLER